MSSIVSFNNKVFGFVFDKVADKLVLSRSISDIIEDDLHKHISANNLTMHSVEDIMSTIGYSYMMYSVNEDWVNGYGRGVFFKVGKEPMHEHLEIKLDAWDISAIATDMQKNGANPLDSVLIRTIRMKDFLDARSAIEFRLGKHIVDLIERYGKVKVWLGANDIVLVEATCLEDLKMQMDLAGYGD